MRRGRLVFAWLSLCLPACSGSPGEPEPFAAPVPDVSLSMAFDDAPVEGFVRLRPSSQDAVWSYAVDLDEDGAWDYEGRLERELGFAYRFDSPGIHAVVVRLEGPDEVRELERRVVVNDPSRIVVEATGRVEPLPGSSGFEGITTSPDGAHVFAGDFAGGAIYRMDRASLEVRHTVELGYGVEGLSVSPSGDFLFVAFKYPLAAFRLTIPDLEHASASEGPPWQNFFVHALDDDRAVFGGNEILVMYDAAGGAILARAHHPGGEEISHSGHFALSPDATRVVVADPLERGVLQVLSLPDLEALTSWELPDMMSARLAFSPDGRRLYALSSTHLYVLDGTSGELVETFAGVGRGLAVANPVALSRDGRFLAFEAAEGVLIVDLDLEAPVSRLAGTASVATDPTVDAGFVVLDGFGGLRRISIVP